MKTRREFLVSAAALAASARLHAASKFSQLHTPTAPGAPTVSAKLAVGAHHGLTIPANFSGLSYETQQLSNPKFFAASNQQLIAQFRALSPHGVLRLGGNTSDFGWWQPTPDTTMPPRPAHTDTNGQPRTDLAYPITPEAIHNLRKFLDETGWTCIYGLNLGTGVPALAAEEAAYVAATLGPRLEYFQIGNEADLFGHRLRPNVDWSPDIFFAEWLPYATTVAAKVPGVKFGAPDVGGHTSWCVSFASHYAAAHNPPTVVALTHHHYHGGPPSNPKMTIDSILAGAANAGSVKGQAADMVAAATQLPVPYRMTEGNTCFQGGKPGVSDVFAASLWAADYLLYLASSGYAGVNLHGGDGSMVANSLGGHLPGEALMKNPGEAHPRPFYTPIANINGTYTAEPVFYGMLFAQQFAGATLLECNFDAAFTPVGATASVQANASAYAAIRPDGKTIAAIINRDQVNDLVLHTTGMSVSSVLRLAADSPDSRDVTFARAVVTPTGKWDPRPESAMVAYGHNVPLRIPRASAVLLVSR